MVSVLVIDDDPALCQVVSKTLDRAGYETQMVHDGLKAIRMIEKIPVDIVVTDLFMPGTDGLEVIAMLRKVAPSTNIVVMSGYDSNGEIDYLKAAKIFGATSIIRKPFRQVELLDAVAACAPEKI